MSTWTAPTASPPAAISTAARLPYHGGMMIVLDMLYALAFAAAFPFLLLKSFKTGKYRSDWPGRFGRVPQPRPLNAQELENVVPEGTKTVMLHCVSVGELMSVRQLVDRLLESDPRLQLVITTTTDTGTARARHAYAAEKYAQRVKTYRYPLDFSFAVRRFLDAVEPDLVLLVELETWPNFLRETTRRNIPVWVINGRMTERSSKRYRLVRGVVAGMFSRVSWFGVQTTTIAERFKALGAPADRITVIPTIKYDTADLSDTVPGADVLAQAMGIAKEHRLLVGGSTGPGEEKYLLDTYEALRGKYPRLRLAIAPRKPEAVAQVIEAITARGLTPVLRSLRPDGKMAVEPAGQEHVLVLNTLGELKKLYSLASMVFVGRSLVSLGGSDMIEVAALAKPCCFGPSTFNFAEAVELLKKAEAAAEVADGPALTEQVRRWLEDPKEAASMGILARGIVAAQRGATQRYATKVLESLRQPASA